MYEGLKAWQDSHALAIAVYRLTSCWPAAERYGLTSQLDALLSRPRQPEPKARPVGAQSSSRVFSMWQWRRIRK
jgi:hypothetical protein